jgi:hypothetical protein
MRCMEARPEPPPPVVKPAPVTCKVKFVPDIQRFLIKDVKAEGHKEHNKVKKL